MSAGAPIPRAQQLRVMTDDELHIALALGRVSFLPATADKRFAREMHARAWNHRHGGAPAPTISERQGDYLRTLAHRYRRQLPAAIAALGVAATPTTEP